MMTSAGVDDLLHQVFVSLSFGDRPFTLLLFFILYSLFSDNNLSYFLENLPILLSPLLMLAVYSLAWSITKDHYTSVLASLITIPSHILASVYGGLFANWFSLIWVYLAIIFLFKSMNDQGKINFFIFSVILIILLFSHAPTWTILMYVMGLFLVIVFVKNIGNGRKFVKYIFISILPSIFLDIARLILVGNSGVLQEIDFALHREVGIHGLNAIWHYIISTTHFTLAGQIANPIILLLVVFWLYNKEVKEIYSFFFIVFFSLFALPLFFGDAQIQSRFFYDIPFQLPAAIALMQLREKIGIYMIIAICAWLVVMSMYMATNFIFVIH
jgi:hypothetical protein